MFAQASVRQSAGATRVRGASSENFPVASLLLPARVRAPVIAFYRFARAADDVADDPALDAASKLARLSAFESGLDGRPGAAEALALRAQIGSGAPGIDCARALLGAFRMDAVGRIYASWDDLMGYCVLSANPVGRFLLGAHGEPDDARALSDPLCTALQVLNHLQDLAEDRDHLDRVYLPGDWLAAEGVERADLSRAASTPGLRRVIDRALDACDDLLARAVPLPGAVRDPGLRAQARATMWLAIGLSRDLRSADPLMRRVAPGRWRVGGAVTRAALWRMAGR